MICDLKGKVFNITDMHVVHTVQSTCKVLSYCLALMEEGKREYILLPVAWKPWVEPSDLRRQP